MSVMFYQSIEEIIGEATMIDIDDNVVLENGETASIDKKFREIGTNKLYLLGTTTLGRQVVWDAEGYVIDRNTRHPYDILDLICK